jgi:hypothetical protein
VGQKFRLGAFPEAQPHTENFVKLDQCIQQEFVFAAISYLPHPLQMSRDCTFRFLNTLRQDRGIKFQDGCLIQYLPHRLAVHLWATVDRDPNPGAKRD